MSYVDRSLIIEKLIRPAIGDQHMTDWIKDGLMSQSTSKVMRIAEEIRGRTEKEALEIVVAALSKGSSFSLPVWDDAAETDSDERSHD